MERSRRLKRAGKGVGTRRKVNVTKYKYLRSVYNLLLRKQDRILCAIRNINTE